MAGNLYRVYLYVVCLALLIFGAVATDLFVTRLLFATALQDSYNGGASRADVIHAAVFAVVAWILIAGLGGLHYWLIRRDMRSDPMAAGGGVRAFLLNFVEAIAVLVAIFTVAGVVGSIGQQYTEDSGPLATGLTALGVAVVLELERRRARAASRPALVFERLHVYGVPFLVLLTLASRVWTTAVQQSASSLLAASGRVSSACHPSSGCVMPSLAAVWAAVGVVVVGVSAYAFFSRRDTRSMLRLVFHLLSFAYGMIFVLIGLESGIELATRRLIGASISWSDFLGYTAFLPVLTFGLVVAIVFALWLRADAADTAERRITTGLQLLAIATGLLAVPFWVGCGAVLYDVIERVTGGSPPSASAWTFAVAMLITGLAYVVAAPLLGRRSRTATTVPHRAVVFALLAAGTLTTAIGAATSLYVGGIALLGKPVNNWQGTLRSGLVVLAIGALVAGLSLRSALRNRYFGGRTTKPEPTPVEATPYA